MTSPIRIVSLGTTCHVAQLLKDAGRKPESTPFDWIFSTPAAVTHMLADDFRSFLDLAEYVDHRDPGEGLRRAGHARYHDRMFNHHDPRRAEDHAYFTRCVERFRALGTTGERVLFVMGHMNQRQPARPRTYERVFAELRRRTPTSALLAIHHVPDEGSTRILELGGDDGLRIVQIGGGRSDGRRFASSTDDAIVRRLILGAHVPVGAAERVVS